MRLKRILGTSLAMLAFGIAILPSAHATVTTLCPSGDVVASDWRNEAPTAECQIGQGAKICKAWVRTCKKLVRETIKCHKAQASGTAKIEKLRCKLGGPDPKLCKQIATEALKFAKQRAKDEQRGAFENCENYFDTCVSNCEN